MQKVAFWKAKYFTTNAAGNGYTFHSYNRHTKINVSFPSFNFALHAICIIFA